MMKKDKTLKIAFSGALLLAVVAAGITMYRSDNGGEEQAKQQEEEQQLTEEQQSEEEIPETADVTANDAQAENTQNLGEDASSDQNAAVTAAPEATGEPETSSDRKSVV